MPEIIDRRVSFNAGEISPWLDPRIDMEKYRMGCRQLQNMRPTIYGGALRRPGTEYLGAALTASTAVRLLPFTRAVDSNYLLEFSNLKFRIWDAATGALVLDTGVPVEVVTPYTAAQLPQLQFSQQNDVMFITHPAHFPRVVARVASGQWGISEVNIDWPVTLGPNLSTTQIWPLVDIYATSEPAAWTAATDTAGTKHKYDGKYYIAATATLASDVPGSEEAYGKWIEGTWINAAAPITAPAYSSATYYVTGDVVSFNSLVYIRKSYLSGVVKGQSPSRSDYWSRINNPAEIDTATGMVPKGRQVVFKSSLDVWGAHHVGTKWLIGHRRLNSKISFKPNDEAAAFVTEPLYVLGEWTAQITQPTAPSSAFEVVVIIEQSKDLVDWEVHESIISQLSSVQQLLTGNEEDPIFLRLKLQAKSGSVPSAMGVELVAGSATQTGIITIMSVASGTQCVGLVETPIYRYLPTTTWEEPAWHSVNGFPRALALHESRLFFGGNLAKPTTVWGSAIDAYQDFRLAAAEDRAVSYTLASDESSAVEWLVSQDMLVIGTTSGEWVMGQRPGEEAPKLRRNTSYGSATVQARVIGDTIVFCQRSRRKLREFAWSFERDGYQANDLTMLSEHLGDAVFLSLAIQRNPENVAWLVTTRGDLLSLTYERGQGVAGWARHVTDGIIESVAVVGGSGEEDHVWLVVKRTVNAATVRYIERFQPDITRALKNGTVEDYTFVDCSKKYSGSGMTAITGMLHLRDKVVSVIGDGKPQANKTVSATGTLTITACNKAIIGLPYTSTLEPTYLETSEAGSMSKAAKKRLHRVALEFWKSYGMEISGDGGLTWQPMAFPVTADYAATVGLLYSGLHEHFVEGGTARQASVQIRQTTPMPLNLMALALRYNVEAS